MARRVIVLGGGAAGVELAQVVRRLGGEVALVDAAGHVPAREPAPLGEALGEALRRDGIELMLGVHATLASRDGEDFVMQLEDGPELRGNHLLVATGRRPRVEGIGLETVGATEAAFSAAAPLTEVAKTATCTHAYAVSNGLRSDTRSPRRATRSGRGHGERDRRGAGRSRRSDRSEIRRRLRHRSSVPIIGADMITAISRSARCRPPR